MKTEYLREFIAFIQAGNLGAASEKLGLPQTSLSRHLSEIEHEVGFELFIRDSKYRITPAGLSFYNGAIQTLRELDMAIQKTRIESARQRVSLVIQEIPIRVPVFYNRFCELALELGQKHPEIYIDNHIMTAMASLDGLRAGQLDVAQLPMLKDSSSSKALENDDTLTVFPIADDALSVWLCIDHPLASKTSLTLADISSEPILASINYLTDSFEILIDELFGEYGLKPLFQYIETESFTDFLLECGNRNGICILPTSAEIDIRIVEQQNLRTMRPLDDPRAFITYYLAILKDSNNPGVLAFRKLLEKQ